MSEIINKLPSDLLYFTFEFLTNEDIINITCLNKNFYNMIQTPFFKEFLAYRNHPLVFNYLDNYCNICNNGLYIIDDQIKYITCKHPLY